MKIILALLIFSAIILFHELGHFLLAKKNKIVVTEFSLGMGPRLLSTEKNGTRYSLKLLPLGGSCAMLGEDMEDESKGTFNGAPVWGRIATVAAGPVFNFILAFVFAVLIVTLVGYDPAEVTQVESGSTVAEAGLQEGDIIKEYQGYHIDLARDLYLYMYLNNPQEDETIHMTVERNGKDVELAFKPDVQVRYLLGFNRKSTDSLEVASLIPGMGLSETGVEPGDVITSINGTRLESSDDYTAYLAEHPLTSEPVTITYERDGLEYNAEVTPSESRTAVLDFSYNLAYTKTHGFEVLKYGTLEVKYMIRSTLLSLKELLTGGLGVKDLSGPVGVVDAIGSTYEASKSEGMLTIWVNMLYMAALLSANLGVMNLLPWGGPTARAATVLAMDATELWHMLIPLQVVGLIMNIVLAVLLGMFAIRHGAGAGKGVEVESDEKAKKEAADLRKSNAYLIFNFLLTVGVIALLSTGIGKSYVIFMLGLCILLAVNYPNQKTQDKLIKKHAPAALIISATLFAAGAMVGVFDGTGMLEAMANAIMAIIPAALGKYVHIIFGILALPLGLCVGTDAYFYGIMPLVMQVGETYGVASLNTALTMLIGKNLALMVSPLVPATYLAIGLTGTELKDHMKFSIPPYYIISLIMLVFGVILGIVAI